MEEAELKIAHVRSQFSDIQKRQSSANSDKVRRQVVTRGARREQRKLVGHWVFRAVEVPTGHYSTEPHHFASYLDHRIQGKPRVLWTLGTRCKVHS